MEPEDSYLTIAAPAEASSRERSSKFLAYAYPVQQEEQIREILDGLRKKYYDATHHCYAWRLGPGGAAFRANDDGEPSGTAGKPILGQLLSNNLTDCLIVVVRYFGGTKLGVPGLIAAYRESAAEAIAAARIVERTVDRTIRVDFPEPERPVMTTSLRRGISRSTFLRLWTRAPSILIVSSFIIVIKRTGSSVY